MLSAIVMELKNKIKNKSDTAELKIESQKQVNRDKWKILDQVTTSSFDSNSFKVIKMVDKNALTE